MELKEIESLAKRDRYDEALAECEKLLRDYPEKKIDVLRTRAYIFARSGDYEKAVKDGETILELGEVTIRDYYCAADHALSSGQFEKAVHWFQDVLRLGDEQNETWFKSASYFYLAYAQMELGRYQEAIANLDCAVAVEDDVAMPLPGLCGMVGHQQLRSEIKHRAATK